MFRAQKVTDLTRRVLMSPSLMMVAFRWRAISIARVAIGCEAPRHSAREPAAGWILAASPDQHCLLSLWKSHQSVKRSGRVRPCSSTGAFSLLTITPVMLVFLAPPKLLRVSSIRSFQLFRGVSALRHNEDDFRIQRFSDFVVQRLGKLVLNVSGPDLQPERLQRLWC